MKRDVPKARRRRRRRDAPPPAPAQQPDRVSSLARSLGSAVSFVRRLMPATADRPTRLGGGEADARELRRAPRSASSTRARCGCRKRSPAWGRRRNESTPPSRVTPWAHPAPAPAPTGSKGSSSDPVSCGTRPIERSWSSRGSRGRSLASSSSRPPKRRRGRPVAFPAHRVAPHGRPGTVVSGRTRTCVAGPVP